ncbi:DUF2019 domain-containing protein, partial [Rhodoblastus sp. 17X3]|uniref:DUF2019 domain-containing protein n=1 Tax=Rhodoblastus sp. 17X3 TaxID=3047026 RepID=UPI0024B7A084
KQSAIDYYSACDDDNFAKQKKVVDRRREIVRKLDAFGTQGRLALMPLLADADQGVRVLAAAFLLKVSPEQAIPVLREISKGPTFFPRIAAGNFLDSYAKGKWNR